MKSSKYSLSLLAAIAIVSLVAKADVSLFDQNNWRFTVSGFVQTDLISDSTRSFREIISTNPVARPDTSDGRNARTQMTVRNSRMSFGISTPKVDDWSTTGLMEFDILGFDPSPGVAGNTEGSYYNSPTFRVRHAYVKSSTDSLELLAGQTWELFGWQPYYFMPTVDIAPSPGMTFNRTVQLRATKSFALGDTTILQSALGVVRPPESDSAFPDLQAGARIAFQNRKSGFMNGGSSGRKLEAMSFAVSGVLRQISVPTLTGGPGDTNTTTGSAVSVNAFIPLIAADDQSLGNTLSLVGSYTTGSGYGDQFIGWSGNGASQLNQATNGTAKTINAAGKTINLDQGIGDFDRNGNFNLEQITSYNLNLQYHLPGDLPDWVTAGFGILQSNNMNSLVDANGLSSAGKITYDQARIYFVNYFHDFTNQIRIGAEYDYVDTEYGDGVIALDRRYQASAFFTF